MEMRLGLICQQQPGGFPLSQNLQEHQQITSSDQSSSFENNASASSKLLSWNSKLSSAVSQQDVKPSLSLSNNLGNLMEFKSNGNKDNLEDVEVMSTDSSSSSSSDSQ